MQTNTGLICQRLQWSDVCSFINYGQKWPSISKHPRSISVVFLSITKHGTLSISRYSKKTKPFCVIYNPIIAVSQCPNNRDAFVIIATTYGSFPNKAVQHAGQKPLKMKPFALLLLQLIKASIQHESWVICRLEALMIFDILFEVAILFQLQYIFFGK